MTEQFRHKYLKSYHVRHRYAEWGGLQTDALVIVANIPLERGSDGYDESKVEDLSKAVSRYVVSAALAVFAHRIRGGVQPGHRAGDVCEQPPDPAAPRRGIAGPPAPPSPRPDFARAATRYDPRSDVLSSGGAGSTASGPHVVPKVPASR